MIKLIDILNEMYVDAQGNLVDKADFVVKQIGYSDLILIDKEKINVNEYIHFQANYSKWNNRKIADTIFKQIMELYNGTALEKYNNTVEFTPTKKINRGGNVFDSPSLNLNFLEGIPQWKETGNSREWEKWALAPLTIEIPIDKEEYSPEGRTFPDISKILTGYDKPISTGPGERAKVTTSKEDIEAKLMYLNITYLPFLHIVQFDKSERPKMSAEKKSDIINVFNEVGLEAFSYLKK